MSFDLNSLDLSKVALNTSGVMLEPGKYICKIEDFKVVPMKSNAEGRQAEVTLKEINGLGGIRAWINLKVPSSAEATRIGLEQYKSLVFFSGHPSPDKPNLDVVPLKGLTVGIIVKDRSYVDQTTGNVRKGVEVSRYIDPADIDKTLTHRKPVALDKAAAAGTLEDEIPF